MCAAPSSFLLLRFEIGKVESSQWRQTTDPKVDNGSPFPRTNAAPKMREFERMKEGSRRRNGACGCRRHESTRNDRSPVRKILVRRHVLLQLDGGGVPSDCHFSQHVASLVVFRFTGSWRGRVFQRHAESNFARERSSGVPPCSIRASGRTVPRRVSRAARVDVGFLAGFARAFRASSDPGTRSSFAESRIAFSLSNRGSPTITKPENGRVPFKRI